MFTKLVKKSDGKLPLGRPRYRWESNKLHVKMGVEDTEYEDV
jgi:hypothetical protein